MAEVSLALSYPELFQVTSVTETFIELINIEIVLLRRHSKENTFYAENTF
jgi:hypothetical protein